MRTALIQCPPWLTESPPYNLSLLAAILKQRGHQPVAFDLNIEMYDSCRHSPEEDNWADDERANCWYDENYALAFLNRHESCIENFIRKVLDAEAPVIGFTVYAISQIFSVELARKIKEKDSSKIIVFGGPQCFRNGEGIKILEKPWIDAICLGEGDTAFPDLLDSIEKKGEIGFCRGFAYRDKDGRVVDCGDAPPIQSLDSLPFADFSGFEMDKYASSILPITTSRGCVHRCAFCSESPCWGKFRHRNAKNIYDELVYQTNKHSNITEFWFNDSLINGNIKTLNELCDLLIGNRMRISWCGQAVIRKEMTKTFLSKLKQAGCNTLIYGVESGSNKILRLMRKNFSAELAEDVIRNTYEAGICPNFNIIVGFPGEKEPEFLETLDFLKRNARYARAVSVNLLHVQAGSELARAREIWGIEPTHDLDTFWRTSDGKNNYEERLRRLILCRNMVEGRAHVTTDEVDLNLRLGDSFLRNRKLETALDCYLKAKELSKDVNRANVIDKKIEQIQKIKSGGTPS